MDADGNTLGSVGSSDASAMRPPGDRTPQSSSFRQDGTDSGDCAHFTVLIADDESSVSDVLQLFIREGLGCQVAVVHDGHAALEYVAAHAPDVLLADMVMPGPHGLELVSMVQRQCPNTDVVVMTGYTEDFPYVSVVRAGAKDFIAKPFQREELQAKLIRVFRERDLRHAQLIAESKYRSLFELNTNGMLFLDDETRCVTDANEAFCALCGRAKDLVVGKPFGDLLDAFERGRFEQALGLCATSGQGTIGDVVVMRSDGEEILVDVSVTFFSVGEDRLICLALKDTTEKRRFEQDLVEAAQTDDLTGLLNRRAFNTCLDDAVSRAFREQARLSLMYLDLDQLKRCNDTHGHPTGDKVIRAVGQVVRGLIRKECDLAFRNGGDEFAVILPGTDTETACQIGERIRIEFAACENFGTSLSIGIAEYQPGMRAGALAQAADQALYRAKGQGRNSVHLA